MFGIKGFYLSASGAIEAIMVILVVFFFFFFGGGGGEVFEKQVLGFIWF